MDAIIAPLFSDKSVLGKEKKSPLLIWLKKVIFMDL